MTNNKLKAKTSDPRFWLEAWEAALRRPLSAGRPAASSNLAYWDGLAGLLEQWSEQGRARERVELIMQWLEGAGVLHPGAEVLDIGAGTGDFALPMARRGARVTALEPAAAVMAALQRRAGAERVEMRFLQQEWEQADPDRDGLACRFDLVFASLCPAVREPGAFQKMIACSRKWCFLCDIARGGGRSPGREFLWQKIFGKPMPPQGFDIIYPANYLYTSGFDISLAFVREEWGEAQPVSEAIAGLERFFVLYTELTGPVKEAVSAYVNERSTGGCYREKYPVRLGMMLWSTHL